MTLKEVPYNSKRTKSGYRRHIAMLRKLLRDGVPERDRLTIGLLLMREDAADEEEAKRIDVLLADRVKGRVGTSEPDGVKDGDSPW